MGNGSSVKASEKNKQKNTKTDLKNTKIMDPATPKETISVTFLPSMKKAVFDTPTTFLEVIKHPFAIEDAKVCFFFLSFFDQLIFLMKNSYPIP